MQVFVDIEVAAVERTAGVRHLFEAVVVNVAKVPSAL